MLPLTQTGHSEYDFIPPNTDLPPITDTDSPIQEDVINSLSEGNHHANSAVPESGTPLPEKPVLVDCLTNMQSYLQAVGVSMIATAHLSGLAAPVFMSDNGRLYAYTDEQLLIDVIKQSTTGDVTETVIDVALLAHSMQFNADMDSLGVDTHAEADWSITDGDMTTTRAPFVFSLPHPMQSLDSHEVISERAIGLVAGIQNLTLDINGVYEQRDVALLYLDAHLRAGGLTQTQSISKLHNWYGVPRDVIKSVIATLTDEVTDGLPASNSEYRYYLSTEVLKQIKSSV